MSNGTSKKSVKEIKEERKQSRAGYCLKRGEGRDTHCGRFTMCVTHFN
jgi:hypothetical protein